MWWGVLFWRIVGALWTKSWTCSKLLLDFDMFLAVLNHSICSQYGSIWTGPSPKKYYVDRSFWGPYTIFWVTDRSICCHMIWSDMNYLLYYTFFPYPFITVKLFLSLYYRQTFLIPLLPSNFPYPFITVKLSLSFWYRHTFLSSVHVNSFVYITLYVFIFPICLSASFLSVNIVDVSYISEKYKHWLIDV
jgi:hypothetical protein